MYTQACALRIMPCQQNCVGSRRTPNDDAYIPVAAGVVIIFAVIIEGVVRAEAGGGRGRLLRDPLRGRRHPFTVSKKKQNQPSSTATRSKNGTRKPVRFPVKQKIPTALSGWDGILRSCLEQAISEIMCVVGLTSEVWPATESGSNLERMHVPYDEDKQWVAIT